MNKQANIFLVEDDQNFGAILMSYLELHEMQVDWYRDGLLARDSFRKNHYDLCILDVMLPKLDGFSIAASIKEKETDIPIIFLTAKTLKEDVLKGFKLGADDYITKPFDTEVLLYKIMAILKRNRLAKINDDASEIFEIGTYTFDYSNRSILNVGSSQHLSPTEADLLRLLCLHKDSTLSRDFALKTIWGEGTYFTTRSMDVFIARLRKCLKEDPNINIRTLHGKGYRLSIEEQ